VLHIELLGEMRITVEGIPQPAPKSQKARLLLARLSEAGGNIARDALAESLWGTTPASARVSLSTELKNLRRCFGSCAGLLTSTRSYVGLPECGDLRIDVREFAEHFRREEYQEAVVLRRGDFLQDTDGGGEWTDERRDRYRRMAASSFERLAEQAESSGDLAAAARFARSQRDILPNELSGWKRLIRLLNEMGEPLAAEAERNAIVNRYVSRGHIVPPEVIGLIGTISPQPQVPKRASKSLERPPASNETSKSTLKGKDEQHTRPQVREIQEADGLTLMHQSRPPLYSGFLDLDRLLGTLPEPGLTIIAGRPGMGVTTLTLTIGMKASVDFGIPTAFFSAESSETQVAQRFVAMRGRISSAELRRGDIAEQRWPKILKASQMLAAAPLYVDDSVQLDVESIFAKLQQLREQSATRLVIIDSIHDLTVDGGPALDSHSIAGLLMKLRQIARQLDLSMIVTMEVFGDCEKRLDKRPQLQDLPGHFELAARRDLVLLLYRDDYYYADSERTCELDVIVAENRHGPVGQVSLIFDARIPQLLNIPQETDTSASDFYGSTIKGRA
jgi:DNA-binding SARP family transcriptional activator